MEKELKRILDNHISKYPQMTPQDVVKLVFQGEYGGGHLLSDYDRCLAWIKKEYSETKQSNTCDFYEDIGFGFVRVQLSALDRSGLTAEQVADLFYASASVAHGDSERYLQKLALLPSFIDERFAFSTNDLRSFIDQYLAQGGGMLSHSETYRNAYSPAYRVIFDKTKKG